MLALAFTALVASQVQVTPRTLHEARALLATAVTKDAEHAGDDGSSRSVDRFRSEPLAVSALLRVNDSPATTQAAIVQVGSSVWLMLDFYWQHTRYDGCRDVDGLLDGAPVRFPAASYLLVVGDKDGWFYEDLLVPLTPALAKQLSTTKRIDLKVCIDEMWIGDDQSRRRMAAFVATP